MTSLLNDDMKNMNIFTVVSATVYLPETKRNSVNNVAGIFEQTEHLKKCAKGLTQLETGSKKPHQADTQAELAPLNEAPNPVQPKALFLLQEPRDLPLY